VIARADGQCQWWDEEHGRCPATSSLHAHHLEAFRAEPTYDPRLGIALCAYHHRLADARLRDARAA
jgi:hypothetical protein